MLCLFYTIKAFDVEFPNRQRAEGNSANTVSLYREVSFLWEQIFLCYSKYIAILKRLFSVKAS